VVFEYAAVVVGVELSDCVVIGIGSVYFRQSDCVVVCE